MSIKEIGFRGKGIKTKFDLVLAFQEPKRQDNFEQLAWRVIQVPEGDSNSGTVQYEDKFAVSTPTVDKGFVIELGRRFEVKLGHQVTLVGTGDDIGWAPKVQNLDPKHQSDIWVVNDSDRIHDIYIHVVDPKSTYPAPILRTSAAVGNTSKATFEPKLSAYFAAKFPHDPVQSTADVASNVITGFHNIDLTTLDDKAYYVITEEAHEGFTIALDPEWKNQPGTAYQS